jgi:hypothetical protein
MLGYNIDKTIKDDITSILSDMGSMFFPKSETKLYFLAMYPSKKSLNEARKNIFKEINL